MRERDKRLFPKSRKGQYSEIKYWQNKVYINFQMNLFRHGCGTNRLILPNIGADNWDE